MIKALNQRLYHKMQCAQITEYRPAVSSFISLHTHFMKIFSYLTALVALLAFTHQSLAQSRKAGAAYYKKDSLTKVHYGIKAGVNLNQVTGAETYKPDFTPGFSGGGFIASTRKWIGFRADAMISSSRYNLVDDSSFTNAHFNIINADITALLEIQIIPSLWLQVGPQFSTFISVSQKPDAPNSLDPKNYFTANNFSAVGGLELRLPYNLALGARYVYGFSDIRSDIATVTTEAWNTRTIHTYIGYRFK